MNQKPKRPTVQKLVNGNDVINLHSIYDIAIEIVCLSI